jgi:predicted RNA-binding protein with TRAM domain
MSYGNRRNDRYGSGGRSGGGGGYSGGYSGGSGGQGYGPKPVETGKEYNVEVIELSRRGDGLAKIQGFIIFVKGSKVGDKVKIKIETVGPRFATASVVGNAEPSSDSKTGDSSKSDSSVTEPVA